ncbi:GNAT family N-acetyltransferase [Candidatus Woesearchaeota archaeon]|nr:GNAT family N-acetyltransferase [Candidatus Woesearchaeota archaeon]
MVDVIEYRDAFKHQTKVFILSILTEEFGLGDLERPDLDDIQNIYQTGGNNFWIAVDGSHVVGSVALLNYGMERGYLKRMYVEKGLRGSGLARELLETLLNYARTHHFKDVYLGTIDEMIAANKFYQKHGFEQIKNLPPDMPDFGDTVFYRRRL